MAALVYELAADMERRSQQLEAHWTISPDVESGQVVIELAVDHEAELANEFVANVMSHHQLLSREPRRGNHRARHERRNRGSR